MNVEARTTCEPAPDLGVFVSAIVINHEVNIQMFGHAAFDVTQEAQELLKLVSQLALSEHLAVGDIERREQRGRAVANVVVSDAFEVTQSHRQHGLRALKRLHLALFVDTHSPSALSGGFRYKPTTSRTFSMKNGSVESLRNFERCGCTPNRLRYRCTVLLEIPFSAAKSRTLQCVAACGRRDNTV